jgi:hypothetical protein
MSGRLTAPRISSINRLTAPVDVGGGASIERTPTDWRDRRVAILSDQSGSGAGASNWAKDQFIGDSSERLRTMSIAGKA